MTDTDTPQWQPLSALAQIARDIDEQFTNTREQYDTLLEARDRPHVLDDAIVTRFIRLITDELEFLSGDAAHAARWADRDARAAPGQLCARHAVAQRD